MPHVWLATPASALLSATCPHCLRLRDVPAGATAQTNEPLAGVPGCFLSGCKAWGSSSPHLPPHPGPWPWTEGHTGWKGGAHGSGPHFPRVVAGSPLCRPLSAFLLNQRKEEAISQLSSRGFLLGTLPYLLGEKKNCWSTSWGEE